MSVMEILHTAYVTKAKIDFENADFGDISKRNSYAEKTPTTTLPFLETEYGNISESISIENFLARNYQPELLGGNLFEKAKVNQWIEFASCEIQRSLKEIIYPIFQWKEYDKKLADSENQKIKKYLLVLEKELGHDKKYLLGDKMTLADIVLFRYLRFFMMFHFIENMRNSLFPKLTKWFVNIMNTPEAIEAYGRTILCKKQIKPLNIKIDRTKRLEQYKKGNKEKNPLDSLPPSSFDLDAFKNLYLEQNNENKKEIMEKLWEEFDSKGYSLWWMEYQNLESEGKKLFRMNNSKNFFLERIDEDFKNYALGVHGVYGNEGNYKVRGVWLWRGNDIPKEIKENEYFNYMTIKKLDSNNKNDRQLVNDYWTKVKKGDTVEGKTLFDLNYF
jgi:elongation factor 1-gamma